MLKYAYDRGGLVQAAHGERPATRHDAAQAETYLAKLLYEFEAPTESSPRRLFCGPCVRAADGRLNRFRHRYISAYTYGTLNPGTKSGNYVPDYQPVSALNTQGASQRLYPQY